MAKEINLPKVSMGQTEGNISEWLVEEGVFVEKDQLIMVMETEKVAYDLESPDSGFIKFNIELGEITPCGTTVAFLADSEEEYEQLKEKRIFSSSEEDKTSKPQTKPIEVTKANEDFIAIQPVSESARKESTKKIKITPVAKKIAKQHNIDISKLKGTGPTGRIKIIDVQNLINNGHTNDFDLLNLPSKEGKAVKHIIKLQGIRKSVADHMVQSLAISAQTNFAGEVEMTELIKMRTLLNNKLANSGDKISYNDIIIYIMAQAIKETPIVNSSLVENEIVIWDEVNIAIAVSIDINEYESGLFAPVIKGVDKKSLLEISRETKELIGKARDGKLSSEDLNGGTITLAPLGSIVKGYSTSTPIINQPQAFILNTGAIVDRVIPVDGQPAVRPIMTISNTFDHRILDGIPTIRFFNSMKEMIENPYSIML